MSDFGLKVNYLGDCRVYVPQSTTLIRKKQQEARQGGKFGGAEGKLG